jgi:hypothetical protein
LAKRIVTGIKIATIAVLFIIADAILIEKRYVIKPIILFFSISFVTFDITYSRMPSFCIVKLIINKHAIVITAGFEKPERPSSIESIPVANNIPRIINAVTSTGRNSVEKSIKAILMIINTNTISNVIL